MFGAIPADMLFDIMKREGYMEQLPLIETPPEYTIDEKYLTSVPVTYAWLSSTGNTGSTLSSVDHPSFTALREHLGATKYIQIERGHWNGDHVLKTFKLNGTYFEEGERFPCASAMRIHLEVRQRIKDIEHGDVEIDD